MSEMCVIKIFGERNTGTNYLEQLLMRNIACLLLPGTAPRILRWRFPGNELLRDLYFDLSMANNLGWKHSMPCSDEAFRRVSRKHKKFLVVTLTKNPYSWLLSLYKRPYHQRDNSQTFLEFLTRPWETVGRENYESSVFKNPIDMWSLKTKRYLELSNVVECVHLRYEDLLNSPMDAIKKVACYSDWLNKDRFFNIEESTKEKREKSFDNYKNYYLNEEWRAKLDFDSIRFINNLIDKELMKKFSYDVI